MRPRAFITRFAGTLFGGALPGGALPGGGAAGAPFAAWAHHWAGGASKRRCAVGAVAITFGAFVLLGGVLLGGVLLGGALLGGVVLGGAKVAPHDSATLLDGVKVAAQDSSILSIPLRGAKVAAAGSFILSGGTKVVVQDSLHSLGGAKVAAQDNAVQDNAAQDKAAQHSSTKYEPIRELQTKDMPLDAFGHLGGLIEARFYEPHAATDDPREEIRQAASLYGLDLDMMMSVAKVESNFNPRARTGSYKGLFQLSDYEFEKYGDGSIWDARDNARAAARMFLVHAEKFKGALGRYPGRAERYMVHQQGIQGAIEHYTHPERVAWQSMCETDEGVLKGEKWCKKCIWQNLMPQWKKTFKSVEKISSGDFVGLWTGRINGLAEEFNVAQDGASPSPPAKSRVSLPRTRPTASRRATDRVAHRAR